MANSNALARRNTQTEWRTTLALLRRIKGDDLVPGSITYVYDEYRRMRGVLFEPKEKPDVLGI